MEHSYDQQQQQHIINKYGERRAKGNTTHAHTETHTHKKTIIINNRRWHNGDLCKCVCARAKANKWKNGCQSGKGCRTYNAKRKRQNAKQRHKRATQISERIVDDRGGRCGEGGGGGISGAVIGVVHGGEQ